MTREFRCRADELQIGDEVQTADGWILLTDTERVHSHYGEASPVVLLTDSRGRKRWANPSQEMLVQVDVR